MGQPTKQLFRGALLLTVAGIVSKCISAGYRIPLQNITGDLGFYMYQQVYPILGIALTLSLYGFPAAISQLVANLQEEEKSLSVNGFYLPLTALLFFINGLLFLFLYLGAEHIAAWMGDVHLSPAFRLSAFTFLLIPFTSLFRGISQGMNDMRPTAISQVLEQITRVTVILFFSIVVVQSNGDLYGVAKGAGVGAIVAAGISATWLGWTWMKSIPTLTWQKVSFSWRKYSKVIFGYGFFICLNYMMLLLLQLSDALNVVNGLLDFGYSLLEAKEWKGVLDRGYPLVQLGTVLGSSLALALIPSVTQKRYQRAPASFRLHMESALRFSIYISAACSVGLMTIMPLANQVLYETNEGVHSLQLLSFTIFFASTALTASSILQGLGYVYRTAIFVLFAFLVKFGGNELLIPEFGIMGAALATIISVLILCAINVFVLKQKVKGIRPFPIPLFRFMISLLVMTGFVISMNQLYAYSSFLNSRIETALFVGIICVLAGCLYVILLIRLRAFKEEDLRELPFADLLIEIQRWRFRP
ncbi:putative polysaccharide biosynthesis protein [Radiobacillus deserti]|uniref:Polysaccharide biosynthesis protein n=1 Tax=Radiobacillus deserti TaxID=2594883 RepID=A0A516KBQ4_9BACI|nr:polysaccharide biosynthesis protein [Radiobacillus deserti]QDP38831.1 polysaccharide biosynthesis protein [Radiobacillus deserti]